MPYNYKRGMKNYHSDKGWLCEEVGKYSNFKAETGHF